MNSYHPTAIARNKLSMPMRELVERDIIGKYSVVLDMGCGRGGDVKHLRRQLNFFNVYGYDPNMTSPDTFFIIKEEEQIPTFKFDIVTLIYVLNVVEDIEERKEILRKAFHLSKKHIFVAVRVDKIKGSPHKDGMITKRKTFQKRYTTEELLIFIESALGDLCKHKVIQKVIKPGMILITKEMACPAINQ